MRLMRRYSSAKGRTPAEAPIASTIQDDASNPTSASAIPERAREPGTVDAQRGRGATVGGADLAGDRCRRRVREEVEDGERRGEDGARDGEPGELAGAELADDRSVDEDVERLGRERPERRERQPPDLGVVGAAPGRQAPGAEARPWPGRLWRALPDRV